MGAYAKIRKYLLSLAVLGCVVSLAHLIFLYAYLGSTPVPEQGGNISVGIMGRAPKLSLLDSRPESSNELVLRFLFRGVMRYNPTTRKVEGDIANCDLANPSDVRCFMNPDVLWNDGQKITAHDVVATYDLYRSSIQNRRMASILSGMKVTESGDSLRFQFPTADVGSLEALFLPVLRATQAQLVTQEGFSLFNLSFSGPFTLQSREYDQEYGVERIILDRNPAYHGENIYVARFTLKFFNSSADLLRSRDTLHVVYAPDQGGAVADSPRFTDIAFLRPQYYAFFLNSEVIPLALRRALVSHVLPVAASDVPAVDAANVTNPFLGDFRSVVSSGSKVASVLAEMGYFSKEEWVRRFTLSGANLPAPVVTVQSAPEPLKPTWWHTPATSPFFTQESNLLLSGGVPENTETVTVNGYRLSKFTAGSKEFFYRASVTQGTLRAGHNAIKARFLGKDGKEVGSESVAIYYRADVASLEADRVAWKSSVPSSVVTISTATGTVDAPQKLAAAQALDSRFFYGSNLQPFTIDLAYLTPLSGIADALATRLAQEGIAVRRTPLDDTDLASYVTGGGKPYGLLLAGINLGMFGYNLYPYFHSGQAESGYNFSKVRDIQLDAQLEKLRSDVRSGLSLVDIQKQVSKTITDLAIFYPLHSPYLHILVDKNLKAISSFNTLPSSSYLSDVLRSVHIRESRSAVWKDKNVNGFFRFLASPSVSIPRP